MSRRNRKTQGWQPLPPGQAGPLLALNDVPQQMMTDYCACMGNVVGRLSEKLGVKPPLFCLLLLDPDNAVKIGQYVSNVVREDMVKALREFLETMENNEDTLHSETP